MQQRQYNIQFGPGYITPVVRKLLIANAVVFGIQLLLNFTPQYQKYFTYYFALTPILILTRFFVWQPVTYMFLHAPFYLWHFAFNMLALWMFGTQVEERMGSQRFLKFYFFCGVGAGIAAFLFPPSWHSSTLGASGAIFGILLAFAMFFPDRIILIYFIIPVKAKYLMLIIGIIEVLSLPRASYSDVAHFAHLGGLLFGYIFLRFKLWSAAKPKKTAWQRRQQPRPRERSPEDWKKVDAILDKVNREGMHKLTRQERNFLREMSRRNRTEH